MTRFSQKRWQFTADHRRVQILKAIQIIFTGGSYLYKGYTEQGAALDRQNRARRQLFRTGNTEPGGSRFVHVPNIYLN